MKLSNYGLELNRRLKVHVTDVLMYCIILILLRRFKLSLIAIKDVIVSHDKIFKDVF